MQIEQKNLRGHPLITVQGRVSLDNSPLLRKMLRPLLKKKAAVLLVDLSKVEHIDSSGVATMIECLQDIGGYGGRLLLVGVNGDVANAFSLAQVHDVFETFDAVADAVASLGGKNGPDAAAR